jgi:hypothetical protein
VRGKSLGAQILQGRQGRTLHQSVSAVPVRVVAPDGLTWIPDLQLNQCHSLPFRETGVVVLPSSHSQGHQASTARRPWAPYLDPSRKLLEDVPRFCFLTKGKRCAYVLLPNGVLSGGMLVRDEDSLRSLGVSVWEQTAIPYVPCVSNPESCGLGITEGCKVEGSWYCMHCLFACSKMACTTVIKRGLGMRPWRGNLENGSVERGEGRRGQGVDRCSFIDSSASLSSYFCCRYQVVC